MNSFFIQYVLNFTCYFINPIKPRCLFCSVTHWYFYLKDPGENSAFVLLCFHSSYALSLKSEQSNTIIVLILLISLAICSNYNTNMNCVYEIVPIVEQVGMEQSVLKIMYPYVTANQVWWIVSDYWASFTHPWSYITLLLWMLMHVIIGGK